MLASLVALALFLYFLYYNLFEKRRRLPPGPTPFPIVGNLLQLDRKAPEKTIANWGKEFGPIFTMWMGSEANVAITDFELIKEALIKNGDALAGRPRNWLFEDLGEGRFGIIFTDGKIWRDHRRFSLQVMRDFGFGKNIMETKIMAEVDKLIAQINALIGQDNSSNVHDLSMPIQLCVGNVISSIILGHTFEPGDNKFETLKRLLEENFQLLLSPATQLVVSYPWLRFLPIPGRFNYPKIWANRNKFMEWVRAEIEEHKKSFDPHAEQTNYVGAYMKEIENRDKSEDRETFGEWQMTTVISDIWVAGMETTVTTLRWGLLYLLHYPAVKEKVQKEIDSVLKDRDVRMADRSEMPYVGATIQEMQRLANILSLNLPHSTLQDVFLNGHTIPKGTTVIPQISAVMIDPKYFPEPEIFDPNRFLESDGKTMKKVEQVVPFSMGKRQCLGESLAWSAIHTHARTIVCHKIISQC